MPRWKQRADKDHSDEQQSLRPREREILQLLAQGKSRRMIATELGTSLWTVNTQVQSALTRLDCHSVQEAIRIASHKGWLPESDFTGDNESDRFEPTDRD